MAEVPVGSEARAVLGDAFVRPLPQVNLVGLLAPRPAVAQRHPNPKVAAKLTHL